MTPQERKELARLYPHAYNAGVEEAHQRVLAHLQLSELAGDLQEGRRAINSLAPVENYVDAYMESARAAGKLGEFAAGCSRVLEPLGIPMPAGSAGIIAAHLTAKMRGPGPSSSGASGAPDIGDQVAAILSKPATA